MNINFYKQIVVRLFSHVAYVLVTNNDYLSICLKSSSNRLIVSVVSILKLSSVFRLNMLTELTAYDNPTNARRFTLVYIFLSLEYNYRVLLYCATNTNIPSIHKLYSNSA